MSLHNTVKKIIVSFLCVIMLTGCAAPDVPADAGNTLTIYYITPEIDSLVPEVISIEPDSYDETSDILTTLCDELAKAPDDRKLYAPLGEESGFISAGLKDDQAMVDFGDKFGTLDVLHKTLIMGAVVRTLTQAEGIGSVSFTVNGSPLLNSAGMVIGSLTGDSFIDNEGLQISADESTQLTLYFANETGDGLVKVNRMVVYSGNIPMDKLVVMQLLEGPHDGENAYPVINPQTKLINVTTQDGTCYVNLDSSFLNPAVNVSNDVAIYSIVDSLIELGTVNKVQFLVDSDSDVMFRETVNLNTQFDRNLDIVAD